MATFDDLDQVVDQYHSAPGEVVRGDPEPLKLLYSHRDEVSLANPFFPPVSGWDRAAQNIERAASRYRDGEIVGFELVAKYITSELACVVEVECYKAKVGGREDISPMALRVTSILRPEEGTWKVVHRHADPITTPQPAESVIQNKTCGLNSPYSPGPIGQKRIRVGPGLCELLRIQILRRWVNKPPEDAPRQKRCHHDGGR